MAVIVKNQTKINPELPNLYAAVLCAGGITGAAYHSGVIKALEESLTLDNQSFLDGIDVWQGISAGAIVSTAYAMGISANEVAKIMRQEETQFGVLDKKVYFTGGGLVQRVDSLLRTIGVKKGYEQPIQLYTTQGLQEYITNALTIQNIEDKLGSLLTKRKKHLRYFAANPDTCQAQLFGTDFTPELPISSTMASSAAHPLTYQAVNINGAYFIDGFLAKSTGIKSLQDDFQDYNIILFHIDPWSKFNAQEVYGTSISNGNIQEIFKASYNLLTLTREESCLSDLKEINRVKIFPNENNSSIFQHNEFDLNYCLLMQSLGYHETLISLALGYDTLVEYFKTFKISITENLQTKIIPESFQEGIKA